MNLFDMNHSIFNNPFFCVVFNSGSIGASSQSNPITYTFASDTDFVMTDIRALGHDDMTCQIQFNNGPVYSNQAFTTSVIGKASRPPMFPTGVKIPAGTIVSVTFNNNNTGTAQTDEIQLWGFKTQKGLFD